MSDFVDIHSHLLPGIDDGPPTMEAALEMIEAAARLGVSLMTATPHLRADFPGVRVDEIAGRLVEVREAAVGAGLAVRLASGAECSLVWAMAASDEELRLASYEQRGKDLLIETPEGSVGNLPEMLFDLRRRGFRVTLAHPERSSSFKKRRDELLRLADQGVVLQVNAGSLSSGDASERVLVTELCCSGLAIAVASDAHGGNPRRRLEVLQTAAGTLDALVGAEARRRLMYENPLAVLSSDRITRAPAVAAARLPESAVSSRRRLVRWTKVRSS